MTGIGFLGTGQQTAAPKAVMHQGPATRSCGRAWVT